MWTRLFVALFCLAVWPAALGAVFNSSRHEFRIDIVTDELRSPWGLAFLPDGSMLVTERAGRLRLVRDGALEEDEISGLPKVDAKGQGGLMGIAVHPDFATNGWIYLAHATAGEGGHGTEVSRGRLSGWRLTEVTTIFRALPKSRGGRHFGSRLVFDEDGRLFISLGDRGERDSAQDLVDHRGSLIRVRDDGIVPRDNPYIGRRDVRPEIYNFGHRNLQGLALDSKTGKLWSHEHGPQGGDEVNIEEPGLNYGWPVITYGANYGLGTQIGEGTRQAGMEQPVHFWVPSIAPSGLAVYRGEAFPGWDGNLFIGSLKFGLLVRLEIERDKVVAEERLLDNEYGRIRDVVAGPDGLIYLLTDSNSGKLLRVSPVESIAAE